MELLLLKSAGCLAVLLLFYKLCLEKLAIHNFKRFYLLGALIISAIIPFITFIEFVEPAYVLGTFQPELNVQVFENGVLQETVKPINYLPKILWSIYGFGVLVFGTKFCINLFKIISKINKNEKQKQSNYITVLLKDYIVPHTFFNYIFLNKIKFESKAIPKEVLLHEETHVKQKHSLDILILECVQIIFWFNPLLVWLKKEVKLNHEFLADQAVLNQGIATKQYQNILLQFSSNQPDVALANAINYSSIKKRFNLMKTNTSAKTKWFRSLLILPLLALLLFSFSQNKEVEKEVVPKMNTELDNISTTKHTARSIDIKVFKNGTYEIDGIRATKSTFKQVINQLHQDITPEIRNNIINIHVDSPKDISNKEVWFIYNAVQDYGFHRIVAYNQEVIRAKGNTPFALEGENNKLPAMLFQNEKDNNSLSKALINSVNKINAQIMYTNDKEEYYKNATIIFRDKNKKVIKSLKYHELSDREKKLLPSPPSRPMKKNPTKNQLNSWLDSKKYGIWLDGKRINNNNLNNYSSTSFVHSFESRLERNAVNYGKHYYQINLYTEDGYNKVWKDALKPLDENAEIFIYYNEKVLDASKKDKTNYSYKATYSEEQDGATKKQIAEYNGLAKKYNTMSKENMIVKLKDVERLKYLYNSMSIKQRKKAEPFPAFPEPPKVPRVPKSTKVKRGEVSDIPPPPPPAPASATPEQKKRYEAMKAEYEARRQALNARIKEKKAYKKERLKAREVIMVERKEKMVERKAQMANRIQEKKLALQERKMKKGEIPPPPPPPKSPLDHVIDMAKKGASFTYNGKAITSDKAIGLVKNNKKLNLSSHTNNGVSTVKLSDKPIKTVNGKVVND